MEKIKLSWADFKLNVDTRKLRIQWFISNDSYNIYAFDADLKFVTSMDIEISGEESADQLDFEANYLAIANKPLSDLDEYGRSVTRMAASSKGTSYKAHFFDFTTCQLGSLACSDFEGNPDLAFSVKYYRANGLEVSTQSDIDLYAIKTVITYKPSYDFELISGMLNVQNSPSEDLRVWVIGGAPELGTIGVKEFIKNLNLKYLSASETLQTNGRVSKFMKQVTVGVPFNTNQMQIILSCDTPGFKHNVMFAFEYFRS